MFSNDELITLIAAEAENKENRPKDIGENDIRLYSECLAEKLCYSITEYYYYCYFNYDMKKEKSTLGEMDFDIARQEYFKKRLESISNIEEKFRMEYLANSQAKTMRYAQILKKILVFRELVDQPETHFLVDDYNFVSEPESYNKLLFFYDAVSTRLFCATPLIKKTVLNMELSGLKVDPFKDKVSFYF